MKFIKELLLSILKTLIVAVVLSLISMSLIQRKFPPSYEKSRAFFQSAQKLFEANESMKNENLQLDSLLGAKSVIASRENLYNELKKLDPTMEDHPTVPKEKEKMPTLPDMNRRDLITLSTKIDQAEYRIRILEYEMKQLKDEYKKLKSAGSITTKR